MTLFVNVNEINGREKRILCYYLHQKRKLAYKTICELLGIAPNTAYQYTCLGAKEITADDLPFLRYATQAPRKRVEYTEEAPKVKDGVHTAYVCEVYDRSGLLFLKIGKSSHLNDRMKAHANNAKYGSNGVKVQRVFPFDNPDDALTMENFLRKHYKQVAPDAYIPQDRFTELAFEGLDANELDEIYNKLLNF